MKINIIENVQGKMSLVAGEVVACREGTGGATGKVVNVKIAGKVWNPNTRTEEDKELDIAFWNDADNNRMLADRITKAKVGVGSFITALVVPKEDGKNAVGVNFKYSGVWTFAPSEDNAYETNVIVGTIASMDEDPDGQYVRVSIPVTKDKDTTEWHKITFWNNEKGNLADRAKTCLKPRADGRKIRAIVVCGQNNPYNDKPNYTAFRFEIIPSK